MTAGYEDYKPLAPVRCDGCGSGDTLPMPMVSLLDRVRWAARYAPFKCRKCRRKLYRKVKKI